MAVMGLVALNVADLTAALHFYQEKIGLRLLDQQDEQVLLGVADAPLLNLRASFEGRPNYGGTGLYHLALRVPTRADLGQFLRHLALTQTRMQGLSDHWVSEALYLNDPEGNGIEVYWDRPRHTWQLDDSGQLKMPTAPLDTTALLAAASPAPFSGLPVGTTIGHIHLFTADLPAVERFYTALLGLDVTARYDEMAVFMSCEGYHHHVAANTWRRGTPSPITDDTLGLRWFTLHLPDYDVVLTQLAAQNVPVSAWEDGVLVRDPVGNGVLLLPA